jgi:hypothetical protein
MRSRGDASCRARSLRSVVDSRYRPSSFPLAVGPGARYLGIRLSWAFVRRADRKWEIESSVVETSLSTYFHRNSLVAQWGAYEDAVSRFLWYAATTGNVARENLHGLARHFRLTKFSNPPAERTRRLFVSHPDYFEIETVQDLLILERDQIVNRILDSNAYGFSRGFWIFH